MINPAAQMENCCNLAFDIVNGKYGWFNEVISLICLIIVVSFFVRFVLKNLHLKYASQKKYWQDSFVRAIYKPLLYFVWFIAIMNVFDLINFRINGYNLFHEHHLHLIVSIGTVAALGWFLFRWKKNITSFMHLRSDHQEIGMDRGKIDMIGKMGTMVILFIILLLLLEVSGRSVNTLIAFGGVGGLALAFASQELIANFFGGLMIYVTRPFSIGDWISLPERSLEGHVEEIGWYMTRIRNFDKRPVYIPNSIFSKLVVITPSRMSHRRFKEILGIRYEDLGAVKDIMKDIKKMLDHHHDIDHNLHTLVHFHAIGNYSLDILIEAYLIRVDTIGYAELREDLFFKIIEIITKHKAELANPTTNIQFSSPLQATLIQER